MESPWLGPKWKECWLLKHFSKIKPAHFIATEIKSARRVREQAIVHGVRDVDDPRQPYVQNSGRLLWLAVPTDIFASHAPQVFNHRWPKTSVLFVKQVDFFETKSKKNCQELPSGLLFYWFVWFFASSRRRKDLVNDRRQMLGTSFTIRSVKLWLD